MFLHGINYSILHTQAYEQGIKRQSSPRHTENLRQGPLKGSPMALNMKGPSKGSPMAFRIVSEITNARRMSPRFAEQERHEKTKVTAELCSSTHYTNSFAKHGVTWFWIICDQRHRCASLIVKFRQKHSCASGPDVCAAGSLLCSRIKCELKHSCASGIPTTCMCRRDTCVFLVFHVNATR